VLVVNADGMFSYLPNHYTGQEQFVILVQNSSGQHQFAAVTITVNPTVNIIPLGATNFSTQKGRSLNGVLTATNPLNRPLSYSQPQRESVMNTESKGNDSSSRASDCINNFHINRINFYEPRVWFIAKGIVRKALTIQCCYVR